MTCWSQRRRVGRGTGYRWQGMEVMHPVTMDVIGGVAEVAIQGILRSQVRIFPAGVV
jgi:hypothetical protein